MKTFISNLCTWLPTRETKAPPLLYAPILFKRRLSVVTKGAIDVIHQLLEKCPNAKGYKDVFASNRAEEERQFLINESLIKDKIILPASFSLSTFNTPISQAALLFGLKAGYTAITPASGRVGDALLFAAATALEGEPVLFCFSEESVYEEYEKCPAPPGPAGAFSCVVSACALDGSLEVETDDFLGLEDLFTLAANNL